MSGDVLTSSGVFARDAMLGYRDVIEKTLVDSGVGLDKNHQESGPVPAVENSPEQDRIDCIDKYFGKLRNKIDLDGEEKMLSESLSRIYDTLYKDARDALRRTKFSRRLEAAPPTRQAGIVMGLPGAGKSSSLEAAFGRIFVSQAAIFDDDEFKKAILDEIKRGQEGEIQRIKEKIFVGVLDIIKKKEPEYSEADLQRTWSEWLMRLMHPAVQRVADEKRQVCMSEGKDFILHKVFAYYPDFSGAVQKIFNEGYSKLTVVYVHAEANEAIDRGKKRAKGTGREVLEGYVRDLGETLKEFRENEEKLLKLQERAVHPILNYFTAMTKEGSGRNNRIDFLFFYNGRSIPMSHPPLYVPGLSRRENDITHREMLKEANNTVESSLAAAGDGPFRPRFHLAPLAGWMSDPYGIVRYRDKWHLFFQHAPYYDTEKENRWKQTLKCWGHSVSGDLLHWQNAPIALAPSEDFDRDGCFSGCAMVERGVLVLVSTGNIFNNREKDDVDEIIYKAISYDGETFYKVPGNPLISERPHDPSKRLFSGHFRDPFIFEQDGSRYMLVAGRVQKRDKNGSILLFKEQSADAWTYKGVLLTSKGLNIPAYMLECPTLVAVGGKTVIFCSPQFCSDADAGEDQKCPDHSFQNLNACVAITGNLVVEECKFEEPRWFELDKGFDFYAVTGFTDDKNRALILGWMGMRGERDFGQGWTGMLTLIREVSIAKDGTITTNPIDDLKELRSDEFCVENVPIKNDEKQFDGFAGSSIEIEVIFEFESLAGSAAEFGVKVRCSDDSDEATTIKVSSSKSMLFLDRSNTRRKYEPSDQLIREGSIDLSNKNTVKMRIFVDSSSVEVFFDDGRLAMSSRIYPKPHWTVAKVFSRNVPDSGDIKIRSLFKWKLCDLAADISIADELWRQAESQVPSNHEPVYKFLQELDNNTTNDGSVHVKWRLARACKDMSEQSSGTLAKRYAYQGKEVAHQAVQLDDGGTVWEAHMFFGALLGVCSRFEVFHKLGSAKEMKKSFQTACDLAGDSSPEPHHSLGQAEFGFAEAGRAARLVGLKGNYERAYDLFSKAESLCPHPTYDNQGGYYKRNWLMLVKVCVALGKKEEAQEWLQKLLQAQAVTPDDRVTLAEAQTIKI